MKKRFYLLPLALQIFFAGHFSAQEFTKIDSLKGSNTQFRNFWDVRKYQLSVEPDLNEKSIKGHNKIFFTIINDIENPTFQIDLQQPMQVTSIGSDFSKKIDYKREADFIWVKTNTTFKKGDQFFIDVFFEGKPTIAKNAPWDGGWVFDVDQNGYPWVSAADEGIGASVWLPTKDIWSDEPDEGIIMSITTPKNLVGVGNGRLVEKKESENKTTSTWEVKNPINAYSIIPSIGRYVSIKDKYIGEKGVLDLEYWVLEDHVEKAKKQFEQVKPMLKAFEYWFGAYPFYEDSYKLVETPFLGMEHQSNIAYGNHFENGYLGTDLSGTGIGLLWDYIIIHESGHEWFANNITAKDQADMWIHESFTMYSEVLFTEHYVSKEAANQYVIGLQAGIANDRPIIGKYGVRNEGSGDMYRKGAAMLHTIRQIIDDDMKFRSILRGLNTDFYHKTVTTKEIENYISTKAGIDLSTVFSQYLTTTDVPILEYFQEGDIINFRYKNGVNNLKLPVRLPDGTTLLPSKDWQKKKLRSTQEVSFDPNYYIYFINTKN